MNKDELAAYNAAVRFLAMREYCAVELRHKLAGKGFDQDCVEAVIIRLIADHYLSEERFAESFLRSRMQRGDSPWLAAEKARQKGVDGTALATALEAAQQGFDAELACRELLSRRDPQARYRDDQRQWQRQARFLRNKGFEAATILRVLNEQPEDER